MSKNRKSLMAFAAISLSLFGSDQAYSYGQPNSQTDFPTCPQFYGGVSIGVQRLSGTRSDLLNYGGDAALVPAQPASLISFSNQLSFANKNGYYSAHLGGTWNILKTAFFWGPEIYLGQGSAKHSISASSFDDLDLVRTLTAQIQQSTLLGGVFQIGVEWIAKTRWSLLLGLEASNFELSGLYTPRSQVALVGAGALGPGVDYPPTTIKTSRWLAGIVWGFGIEKQIHDVRIGVDLRMLKYRNFRNSQTAQVFQSETLFTLIKPQNLRFGLKVSYVF